MYANIVSFGQRILLEYDTHDEGRPTKLRYSVLNKVFLINNWSDVFNCNGCILANLIGAYVLCHDFCFSVRYVCCLVEL